MPSSWKGSISFGLIYIPITLQLAAGEESVSFNQLHKGCGGRVNYKKVCSVCGKELAKEEIVKGYSYESGKYVVVSENELELLKTPKNKSITIEQFVNLNEIDPIFYEKSYYVVPTGGEKAFELLKKAMAAEKKVGIAKIVMGTKETIVALRANNSTMLLNTLFFANEIKAAPAQPKADVSAAEVKMARTLIASMASEFHIELYKDEYQERLKKAIEEKISGQQIVKTPDREEPNNVIDLMSALQASIQARQNVPVQRTS